MFLTRKINKLYKLAEKYYNSVSSIFKMAQEPSPEYNEIMRILKNNYELDLKKELLVIAELYKEVLKIKTGYKTLYKYILEFDNNFLSDLDDEEREPIDEVISNISLNLKKLAGGKLPEDSAETKELFLAKERDINENMLDQTSGLQQFNELAIPTHDFSDQSMGYSNKNFTKSDIKKLEDKRDLYLMHSEEFEEQKYKDYALKTAQIYQKLIDNSKALDKAYLDVTNMPDDQESKKRLSVLQDEYKKLVLLRNAALSRLFSANTKKNLIKTINQLNDSKPEDKLYVGQKIDYLKYLLKNDKNKKKEGKLRRQLLKALKSNSISNNEYQKRIDQINESIKEQISAKQINKDQAAQIAYEKASGSLKGEKIKLGQNIASVLNDLQKGMASRIASLELGSFKSVCENIKRYRKERELEKLKENIIILSSLIPSKYIFRMEKWLKFEEGSKIAYKFRDEITKIENGETDINHIMTTISFGETIISDYSSNTNFNTIIYQINIILEILKKMIFSITESSAPKESDELEFNDYGDMHEQE